MKYAGINNSSCQLFILFNSSSAKYKSWGMFDPGWKVIMSFFPSFFFLEKNPLIFPQMWSLNPIRWLFVIEGSLRNLTCIYSCTRYFHPAVSYPFPSFTPELIVYNITRVLLKISRAKWLSALLHLWCLILTFSQSQILPIVMEENWEDHGWSPEPTWPLIAVTSKQTTEEN